MKEKWVTGLCSLMAVLLLASCATSDTTKKSGGVPQIFIPTDKGDPTSVWSTK
jgi:hypothetical protein